MTEKPILFSGPLVRAILEGRKSVTRRLIPERVQYAYDNYDDWCSNVSAGIPTSRQWEREFFLERCRFAVGGNLWVRETWKPHSLYSDLKPRDIPRSKIFYRADDSYAPSNTQWKPGIHMPRWASRITLEVTGVKVERLQDISEEEAKAEGVVPKASGRYHCGFDDEGEITCKSPVTAYAWLWNSINGEREGASWSDNPWVAAITFRVISPEVTR